MHIMKPQTNTIKNPTNILQSNSLDWPQGLLQCGSNTADWSQCLKEPSPWWPCRIDRKSPSYMNNQNDLKCHWGFMVCRASLSSPLWRGFLKLRPGLLFQEKGTECNTLGNAFSLPRGRLCQNSYLIQIELTAFQHQRGDESGQSRIIRLVS